MNLANTMLSKGSQTLKNIHAAKFHFYKTSTVVLEARIMFALGGQVMTRKEHELSVVLATFYSWTQDCPIDVFIL